MKYIPVITLVLVAVFAGAFGIWASTYHPATSNPLSIAANQINYTTATDGSITCASATSAAVLALQSGRTSFYASLVGATTTYLCRSATGCTSGTGIVLNSSHPFFAQNDGYVGAYSCISASTSTIGISYSQ